MHKFAAYFSIMFLLISLSMLFCIIYFYMPQLLSGNRIVLFAFINSLLMVGVGIFFNIFKERIILYWQNYSREKQI